MAMWPSPVEHDDLEARRNAGLTTPTTQFGRWSTIAVLASLILFGDVVASQAQDARAKLEIPDDFAWPKLVMNGPVGHLGPVNAVIFSPDGKYLVSGGEDKAVRVWEFNDGRPRLDRTIRPPQNRRAGTVHALAITREPDPREKCTLLAVAGVGAIGSGGDILVYRFMGPRDAGTGDLAFVLRQADSRQPPDKRTGHKNAVYGMAFSSDGRYLASSSVDGTIRVWDLRTSEQPPVQPREPKQIRVSPEQSGAVLGVAFLGDERLLASGGKKNGTVCLWEWKPLENSPVGGYIPPPKFAEPYQSDAIAINAMAVSPDHRFVVTAREDGELNFFETATLGKPTLLNPDDAQNLRAVEALAYSPDGNWLAVSLLHCRPPAANALMAPRTECEIHLRRMPPQGDQIVPVRIADDIVRALAFSPDSRFLVTIGGKSQELTVHDLRKPGPPVAQIPGPGTVLWNVGFKPDANPRRPTIAYARNRPLDQKATVWEGFDFQTRRFVPVSEPDKLRCAVTTFDGWSIKPDGPRRLIAKRQQDAEVPIELDQSNGRWMSYTLIPPNVAAGHPKLALAIGCREGAVTIYTLPDGRKTREFLGHFGPVHGLAPSPDGRWLATASADQTVKLWSLAGCNTRPALGARFERDPQGQWVVREITPRSFAEQMGLKVGNHISRITKRYSVGATVKDDDLALDRIDKEIDAIAPGQNPRIFVWFPGDANPRLQSFRRDQPALSLLAAADQEWIAWMPEGYYDTSIAGDRRLLGWHVNKVELRNNRFEPLASEFVPMSRYEKVLFQREVIDRLLETGDPAAALQQARVTLRRPQPPPKIELRLPPAGGGNLLGASVQVQQPVFNFNITATGSPAIEGGATERSIDSIVVRNRSFTKPPRRFTPPVPKAENLQEVVDLAPGDNVLSIEATDDLKIVEKRQLIVRFDPPDPKPAPAGKLVIRSIGIERFADGIDPIEFADQDAVKLAEFLERPGDERRFDEKSIDKKILHENVTKRRILEQFSRLRQDAVDGKLENGDTVFIMLESHVLDLGQGELVLGSDATLSQIANGAIETNTIAENLGYVTRHGCLVVLFLDGIHEGLPMRLQRTFDDFVRKLGGNGVIVVVASKQDGSERDQKRKLSVFVRAIQDAVTVRGTGRAELSPSVTDFGADVIRIVAEQTSGHQKADLYSPDNLAPDLIRIFDPQPRPTAKLAKK
jgi:WD40 repeat protein